MIVDRKGFKTRIQDSWVYMISTVGKHNFLINYSIANTKLFLSSNASCTCGGTNNLLFSTSPCLKSHLEKNT